MLEKINKIYKELTYNDLNGTSIAVSVLLIFIFIGLITYFYIQINIKLLRKDWPLKRCNPFFMPFAGLIMPQKTQSAWEYTEANFSYCSMSILNKLATMSTIPIHLMETAILEMENLILEAIYAIIRLINLIKKLISELMQSLFNKLQNIFIIQLQNSLIMGDIMHRISGMMTTQYYVAISMWNTFGSAMNTMWMHIMTFFSILFAAEYSVALPVAIMVGIAMGLFPIPFIGPGIAAALIGVATTLATIGVAALIVTIVISVLSMWIGPLINLAFNTHTPLLVPGDPTFFWRKAKLPPHFHCFAQNTIIPTLHKGDIPIQSLTPGTILSDKSIVTATMILDSTNETIYHLDKTIVTGFHKVLYKKQWIYVKNHPDAISLPNLNTPVYCFNTTNKIIKLHNTIYSDWDDLEERDLKTINEACESDIYEPLVFENIHKYLEVGFHPDTKLQMEDGTYKKIENIQLGEKLYNREKITGCVVIQGDIPLYVHENNIIGTANVSVNRNDLVKERYVGTIERIYHVLTNTGTLIIDHRLWNDYNAGIERFFE